MVGGAGTGWGQLLARPGPFVIVAKGHSGTRFLARAFLASGVFMGADRNAVEDSMAWYEAFARPLITSRYYPDWCRHDPDPGFEREVSARLDETLRRYLGDVQTTGAWGWKGSVLFVMPVVKQVLPATKFVHLIRDGRDVVLSGEGVLNLPFHHPVLSPHPVKTVRRAARRFRLGRAEDEYRMKVVFGRADIDEWRGITIGRRTVKEHRYLLQMQSWVNNVTTARRFGREMPDDYLEVRYEQLVTSPIGELERIFDFLGVDFTSSGRAYVESNALTGGVGRWREATLEPAARQDFEDALALGRPLLDELGYRD